MRAARTALAASSGLTVCATVTRGSNDAWVVNSEPPGATVTNTDGYFCPSTPWAIKMPRRSQFSAEIKKPGFKPASVSVTHKKAGAGAAGVAGNVLVGGVIGLGVDMATGASSQGGRQRLPWRGFDGLSGRGRGAGGRLSWGRLRRIRRVRLPAGFEGTDA